MKTINVTFEDEEHTMLKEMKKKSESDNWHDFILELGIIQYPSVEDSEREEA